MSVTPRAGSGLQVLRVRGVLARCLWSIAAWILCTGTEALADTQPKPPRAGISLEARRAPLVAARSWAYQLRINDLAALAAVDADVLVVDHGYAARHLGKLMFEPAEVAALKLRPDGTRRIVLAYMSIGEAEQYRFYWQGVWCKRATAPAWLGAVNPNWPGNYPARFWEADWQTLILDAAGGYLSRIQAQGFDGIYLDRTDVYSEWAKERPTAEADMIVFLQRIADAARAQNPKFLVVMQNAEELLVHARVRHLLDGVAKEDLLYGLAFTEAANDAESVSQSLRDLKRARADRIPVFAVEYLSDQAKIETARQRLRGYGFIPYFAPRLLDQLLPQPGAPPPSTPPAATATAAPSVTQPLRAGVPTPAPGPSWAEGAPTCLTD